MNGAHNRPLLLFDLSAIPAGSTINSVTLEVTDLSGAVVQPSTFELHRLLVSWGEGVKTGNQGQAATTDEATWNSRFHDTIPWSTPGGAPDADYVATISGSTLVSAALATNRYTFASTPGLVADAQSWLDSGTTNFGWILISDSESTPQTSRRFGSREDTAGREPKLTIAFSTPPEPIVVTNASVADACLFEYQPDNNLGGSVDVVAGSLGNNGGGSRNRALFRFDPTSQIPPNAIIQSVTLVLQLTLQPQDSPPGSDFALHRVLADWGEGGGSGNQGSAAQAGEVTWNSRFHGSASWTTPGGEPGTDYVSQESASRFADFPGSYSWSSTAEMVADVQFWLQNPSQNFGWMLISSDESSYFTARRWAAKEFNEEAARPKLIIQYVLPAAVTPPAITNVTATGANFSFQFLAEAGVPYTVEKLLDLTATNWTFYTNIPAPGVDTSTAVSDTLSGTNAYYRVRRN